MTVLLDVVQSKQVDVILFRLETGGVSNARNTITHCQLRRFCYLHAQQQNPPGIFNVPPGRWVGLHNKYTSSGFNEYCKGIARLVDIDQHHAGQILHCSGTVLNSVYGKTIPCLQGPRITLS